MKASELIRLLQQYSPDMEVPVSFTPSGQDSYEIGVASCDDGARSRCYQNIVELAGEGMIIVDPDDHVTYMNPYMQKLVGSESTEIVGRPLSRFLAPEHSDFNVGQMHQGGLPKSRHCMRIVAQNGQTHRVEISATPIPGTDGRSRGNLLTVIDLGHQQHYLHRVQDQQSLGEKINGLTEQLEALKRLRVSLMDEASGLEARERIPGQLYWHQNRYLYIVYPQKNGRRKRRYVGRKPERVNAVLAAVRREERYQEVCAELDEIESRIRTLSFKLDGFLLELGRLPPQLHQIVS